MTDNDAPKPDQTNAKTGTPDPTSTDAAATTEAKPAAAEGSMNEPIEPTVGTEPQNAQQAALDMMAALCRDFGLTGTNPTAASNPSALPGQLDQPTETAFQIIQRYLLDGGEPHAPTNGYDSVSEPIFGFHHPEYDYSPTTSDLYEAHAMNNASSDTSAAQWGVRTTHSDGSTTELNGPVISDDMFRTAMPSLQGKATGDAGDPDWSITLHQGPPLAPGRTNAQTAIGARMVASSTPDALNKWSVRVGPSADAQSELSVSLPESVPSMMRAMLFDTSRDANNPQVSEVPLYGGGPFALHLEQSIGNPVSGSEPNLALIRLVFADRAPIPAQLEYVGSLPSPIMSGSIVTEPNNTIPFWVQITPPSEGDKGAGLVILVRYEQEASFDVTAQLLTENKTCTPTAILSCSAQSDNSACRAASMVANSSGRLETSLTGLADSPDDSILEKYGFILPAPPASSDAKAASTTTSDDSKTNSDGAKPSSPTTDSDDTTSSKSDDSSTTAKAATTGKGGSGSSNSTSKSNNTSNTGTSSTKGGS